MSIDEIRKYIIEKYPYSCFSINNGSLMSEVEDFFYYEKLNWCGCGTPNIVKRCIRDFLNITLHIFDESYERDLEERFGVKSVYDSELLLCLAYALDAAELTEHGSGIGGAWLTNEGKMFLSALNENKELDL